MFFWASAGKREADASHACPVETLPGGDKRAIWGRTVAAGLGYRRFFLRTQTVLLALNWNVTHWPREVITTYWKWCSGFYTLHNIVVFNDISREHIHAPGGIRTHDLIRWAACGISSLRVKLPLSGSKLPERTKHSPSSVEIKNAWILWELSFIVSQKVSISSSSPYTVWNPGGQNGLDM